MLKRKIISKSFFLVAVLLILIVLSGYAYNKQREELTEQNKTMVTVTVPKNISSDTLSDFGAKGLKIVGETDDYKLLSGNISKDNIAEIATNPIVVRVIEEEERESNGQISSEEDEKAYELLRLENNVTVGPYIYPEVLHNLNLATYTPIVIRFKIGLDMETYSSYRNEILSKLNDNFKLGGVHEGIGIYFWGDINKEGLEKLVEDSHILVIFGGVTTNITSCTVSENGTKICTD